MANHPISIESAGGEYMESVLVVAWAAKPGETVKAGQLLVTVETAKAATEVEADRDGWLAEIHFREGQEAPVGAVLGTISDVEPQLAASAQAPTPTPQPAAPYLEPAAAIARETAVGRQPGARVVASPLARRLARQAGIDLADLEGSGPNGRIKQRDVQKALDGRAARPPTEAVAAPLLSPQPAPKSSSVPIILLHGFGADRSAWRQVLPLLGKDVDTIALDLPGHGANASVAADDVDHLAYWVSDQLEAMGIEEAHVVGHSLGGATALALTSIGRVAARSLTLLAPGGLGPEINGGFIAGLIRSTTAAALERWLGVMLGDPSSLPHGYAQAVLRQMEKIGNRASLEMLASRLFSGDTQLFDTLSALGRIAVPTRIVWGRSDRVIPAIHAQRAPDFVAVHLLSGVGHVPQMEAPALTARLIMETVRSAA